MRWAHAVVCAALMVTSCQAVADWPQFLGPSRNGASSETGLARTWAAEGPEVLWTIDLGDGFGGPCVQGGKLYVLDREGTEADILRCFDFQTGTEQWRSRYKARGKFTYDGSRTSPAADDKYVFTLGPTGYLHGFSKATRKPIWSVNLLKRFELKRPGWAVSQSPVLHGELVIVAPLGRRAGVVAFAKATGEIVWQTEPLGTMNYSSPLVTTLGGVAQVVMICGTGSVVGIDAGTGKLLWKYESWHCPYVIPSPLALGGDRLFITGGYGASGPGMTGDSVMIQVTNDGGEFSVTESFRIERKGSQLANPVVHDGHVYFNSFTKGNTKDGLICVDLEGRVKWKSQPAPGFERCVPLLADGLIYIFDGEGQLRMIEASPDRYKELGRAKVLSGQYIWSAPALVDGKLIVRDWKQMKCISLRSQP